MDFRHGEGNVCACSDAVKDGSDAFGVNAAEEGVVDGGRGRFGSVKVLDDFLEGGIDLVEEGLDGGDAGGAAVEVVISCAGGVAWWFWRCGVSL